MTHGGATNVDDDGIRLTGLERPLAVLTEQCLAIELKHRYRFGAGVLQAPVVALTDDFPIAVETGDVQGVLEQLFLQVEGSAGEGRILLQATPLAHPASVAVQVGSAVVAADSDITGCDGDRTREIAGNLRSEERRVGSEWG